MRNILLSIMMILSMISCSYKSVNSKPLRHRGDLSTSIAVIKKDPDGYLRNYLAREIGFSNLFSYKDVNAKYKLYITITEDNTSRICFMWDRNPVTNENLGVYYPTEGMRAVIAKVELKDSLSDKSVIEPFYLKANGIYDFVNPTVPDTVQFETAFGGDESVLQYSLGQLDSEEGAKSASYEPIYQDLAQKIVRRLVRSKID